MTDDKKRLAALRRRVAKARDFPKYTCSASRHLQSMAGGLLSGGYPMFVDEPEHCAESIYAVIASLWEARQELAKRHFRLRKA